MADETGPSVRMIAGLAVLCAALAVWVYLGFILPFRAAAAGRDMLVMRLGGYEPGDVFGMVAFLRGHPDAADIQRGLNLGPAPALAVASAALLFLVLKRVKPGGIFFGRPIPPAGVAAIFCLPILYGLAGCGEIILGMLVFPPAMPSEQALALAAAVMPVLTKLKFLSLFIAVILLLRFFLLSRQPQQD